MRDEALASILEYAAHARQYDFLQEEIEQAEGDRQPQKLRGKRRRIERWKRFAFVAGLMPGASFGMSFAFGGSLLLRLVRGTLVRPVVRSPGTLPG